MSVSGSSVVLEPLSRKSPTRLDADNPSRRRRHISNIAAMPGPQSFRSINQAPPSPTLSSTTRASLDFPSRPSILITRADLRNSLNAYEKLLTSSKAYTNAMLAMAKASSDLACALEECARVKGAHDSGPGLQAASGLHFLKSNYEHVLCDTFWKDFSIPLLSHYDTYRAACNDRQLAHDKAISEQSKKLKEAEARNIKTGKKKERDLNQFRRALAELQAHVDSLDELKAQYYHEVLESEEEVWQFIHSKVALVVRSQIDISERISSKGLSDPVLEPMLSTIPDPFDSYGPPKQDDQIFSILPPTSLLSSASSSVHGMPNMESSNGPSSSHAVTPSSLLSPSAPSVGLPRHSQKAGSPSKVVTNGSSDVLDPISEAESSLTTASTATGGLFGSESMDFEELLERRKGTAAESGGQGKDDEDERATKVLSIIQEDHSSSTPGKEECDKSDRKEKGTEDSEERREEEQAPQT